ncbi:MAG: lipoprotein-releasing ABC transporter permease subunit [Gammaproteobacteria bacterium]
MFRPLQLFIGLRYTGAGRRNHFISLTSFISIIGIMLGVAALIIVISVMNGFEKELHQRILGMVSHATIYGTGAGLEDWPAARDMAERHPRVIGAAPFVQREGMIAKGKQVSGVLVRGVLPGEEPKVSEVGDKMIAGSLDTLAPGEYSVLLGVELARFLDVFPGEKITLVSPQATATPAGILPRYKRFTVSGIFEIGHHEYDRNMAVVHMRDAQVLYRTGERVTGVRVELDDLNLARSVAREIALSLPGFYAIRDWTREHANFFKAIATEKTVMFIILSIIVLVAAINIIATLVMMVTDKQSDIAILRTLGATPAAVMGVFLVQGTVLGLAGTGLGVLFGVLIAVNIPDLVPALENLLGVQFLSPDVYYISDLPSDVQGGDILRIVTMSVTISILATIPPALLAAFTQPAEALRYE